MREEIEIMEESRTDYRAALSWLRATTVDPDKLGQIEKFRRVQAEVKQSKERFDIMKGAIQVCLNIIIFKIILNFFKGQNRPVTSLPRIITFKCNGPAVSARAWSGAENGPALWRGGWWDW